ncbi:MAG: glycosyltransferase [Bradyrhizobiaceae bacterium]|nr:glycosyltransferase [Bradyrhizobiaceae bacterium]
MSAPSSRPSLSIIIPVLNEEKLLESTLIAFSDDLLERYQAEIVVSDGGSTDATLDIARKYRTTIVEHSEQHRQTIAEGRDKGAQASRGTVLVFINGDTVPADVQRFLEVVTDFAQRRGRYARATALACPVCIHPSERTAMDSAFHTIYNRWVWLLNLLRIGAGRGECQIIRREAFEAIGGYRRHLAAGEDFDMLARVGLRARVMFAKELMVYESPRRYRRFGYFRILWWWTINALSVLLTGKSSSDTWEPVR